MAERRMFTKKVTDDDNFMSLSSSAQALYLHLSMSADDDGFCNQVSVSMFKAHASVQDLQALLEKRYVYQFENGVIVIKHWRMANALRKDRYTPTVFQEELSKLQLKENGSYGWLPDGCQLVAERLPQDRLGKNRLDKVSNNTNMVTADGDRESNAPSFEEEFDELWKLYPRKQGKQDALRHYIKARKHGVDVETIRAGIEAYVRYIKTNHIETRFVKQGSAWFNQGCWSDDYSINLERKTNSFASDNERPALSDRELLNDLAGRNGNLI